MRWGMRNMTWKIVIPYEIPSQNKRDRWHPMQRHRDTRIAERSVGLMAKANGIPVATGKRTVRITSYRRRRIADYANLVGGAKGLVDAMVRVGLLDDDSDEHCTLIYCQDNLPRSPLQRIGKGWPCTMLEIEE